MENIALQNLKILYTFGLRAEIATTFFSQYKSIQNFQTLQGYIFYILQHFANKLCNFANLIMCSQADSLLLD
jgi:hypothetical protein